MPTLAMPNPCPHVTRLDLIGAKLRGGEELDELLAHLEECLDNPPQA